MMLIILGAVIVLAYLILTAFIKQMREKNKYRIKFQILIITLTFDNFFSRLGLSSILFTTNQQIQASVIANNLLENRRIADLSEVLCNLFFNRAL